MARQMDAVSYGVCGAETSRCDLQTQIGGVSYRG